ncbi:D-arabinono-1,4-lactone oxidase [Dyadobacter sp. 3J3]|uniref:D-arabinono-1,4-lactone oxidase n=1 Tax=Dyadobacter sp. 3J3 TaxID=2606600 RepID=UPI001359AD53|nr:D-arabinono-1,4-lactone oxidase [Dyadobacter sp. 3J3]
MKKRTFLKISSALMTAPLLSPLSGWATGEKLKNWAGNLEYSTTKLYQAKSTEQVSEFVKKHSKFKVLGTRHCFNKIADSKDEFISLTQADELIEISSDGKTVTVNSGLKYGQLSPVLDKKGYALHNLASLPHISVAGACATATHGSGNKNGNLSTAVSGMEMVTGTGETIKLTKEKDGQEFLAAVVNLGALGVVTKVTLDIQPTFEMNQYVYQNLSFEKLKDNFETIESKGYSVSLFTNWQSRDIAEVWVKRKIEKGENYTPDAELFGAKLATKNLHPIPELSAENCTVQMGVPGPWYERMPHFKMGFTPSSGVELQSEYFVPRKNAVEAIMAVYKLADLVAPHLMTTEIRTIAADDLWMSPCYKQDSVAIHFTWKQDWPNVSKVLPVIERELAPFNARPHWGKMFTMAPAKLQSLYDKLPDFQEVIKEYDPQGKFRNGFLDMYIYKS